MDKKLLYESPTTDVFVVQIEGVVCQSVTGNTIPDWQEGNDFPSVF